MRILSYAVIFLMMGSLMGCTYSGLSFYNLNETYRPRDNYYCNPNPCGRGYCNTLGFGLCGMRKLPQAPEFQNSLNPQGDCSYNPRY